MIHIPAISVMATATDRRMSRVLEVGMDEYITKPIGKDERYSKINACLKANGVSRKIKNQNSKI